jgi:hypothetical protein
VRVERGGVPGRDGATEHANDTEAEQATAATTIARSLADIGKLSAKGLLAA